MRAESKDPFRVSCFAYHLPSELIFCCLAAVWQVPVYITFHHSSLSKLDTVSTRAISNSGSLKVKGTKTHILSFTCGTTDLHLDTAGYYNSSPHLYSTVGVQKQVPAADAAVDAAQGHV